MKFYSPEVWFIENTSTDFKMMEDFSRLCWANCWTPFIKSTSGHQHNGRELVYSQVRKWSTIHQPWTTVKLRVLEIKNQTLKTFQSRHQSVTQVTQNDSWFVWKQHETNKVLKRCFFLMAKLSPSASACLVWIGFIPARISDKTWIWDVQKPRCWEYVCWNRDTLRTGPNNPRAMNLEKTPLTKGKNIDSNHQFFGLNIWCDNLLYLRKPPTKNIEKTQVFHRFFP